MINMKNSLIFIYIYFVTFCSSFMFTADLFPVAALDTVFLYVGNYFTDSIYIVTILVFQNYLFNQL